MLQFNIAIYITILLSIIGCDFNRLNKGRFEDPNPDNIKSVIVLLHGLGRKASCFYSLAGKLKKSFPAASVTTLSSVEEDMTSLYSIKEQANCSFEELLEKIPDLRNRPIILIGHSQGGLRAYKMFDLYKNELNVKGIITLATPWEGAPILNADHVLFSEYLKAPILLDEMGRLSKSLGAPHTDWVKEYLNKRLEESKLANQFSGSADLKPGSKFLNKIRETLPKTSIPILAIGGAQSDFRIFLTQKSNHHFKALNTIWTQLIVGNTDLEQRHDMIIPLYSQLALNIMPEKNTNFRRVTIPDALHDDLFQGSPMSKSKNILAHPAMIKNVIEFIRSVLDGSRRA